MGDDELKYTTVVSRVLPGQSTYVPSRRLTWCFISSSYLESRGRFAGCSFMIDLSDELSCVIFHTSIEGSATLGPILTNT